MRPVGRREENISVTALELVLIFGHVARLPPSWPALGVWVCAPIVEDLLS